MGSVDNLLQQKGDQLFIFQDQWSDRIKRVLAAVIASAVLGTLSTLPLLAVKGDSTFFWGLAILGWGIGVVATGRILVRLVTERGIVFDRARGTVLIWSTRLGRRRETLHDLKSFESLHLSTWMRRVEGVKGGHRVQVTDVELCGPGKTLLLEEISDPKGDAPKIAEFLSLPLVRHGETPDP